MKNETGNVWWEDVEGRWADTMRHEHLASIDRMHQWTMRQKRGIGHTRAAVGEDLERVVVLRTHGEAKSVYRTSGVYAIPLDRADDLLVGKNAPVVVDLDAAAGIVQDMRQAAHRLNDAWAERYRQLEEHEARKLLERDKRIEMLERRLSALRRLLND